MTNKILDIIHRDFSEYSELINNKSKWSEPDYLDKQYTHYNQPHTQEYHNPIGAPLFLVTIKKLEQLNMFPLIFVRDGITSIAHFFFKNPTPKNIISTLAIPKEAEFVIPKKWIKHCITYEIKRYKTETKDRKKIILVSSISENLYNLERLKEKLLNIKDTYNIGTHAIVFDNVKLGEEYRMDYNLHNAEFYRTLFEVFGNDLEISNWEKSKNNNFSNTFFFETNENHLNYTDSYVTNLLLSQGSQPIGERYPVADFCTNSKRISRYHFFHFCEAKESQRSKELWKEIEDLKDLVLGDEEHLNRSIKDFEKIQLCTREFEDIIKSHTELNETL